ncbi:MAG: aminodeoxychorismate lyase [Microbacteriaceae bacterium]
MATPVLAILNQPSTDAAAHVPGAPAFALADPDAPQITVLDLGVTRGDGVFETIGVGNGHPQALEAHLRRFAHSAELLDLPAPDPNAWRAAILAVIDALGPVAEASIKTVMTRGIEGDGRPTGWVHGSVSPDYTADRTTGLRVVTLDRGFTHDVQTRSPWLLAGAKSLSYAINRAVLREAARRDADDVIFVSSDGFVLEGPTSTVLARRGSTLITPGTGLGILDGTTQGSIFRFAAEQQLDTAFELLTVRQLAQMDALWLVSSVRHAAPINTLDGSPVLVDTELSRAMNLFLLRPEA